MDTVKCWHCNHYKEFYFNIEGKFTMTDYGLCKERKICRYAYDSVCRGFVLRQGLYTKKRIPDFKD